MNQILIQKNKVVETAAKFIRHDIKAMKTSCTAYPTCDELDDCINFLPETLRVLLEPRILAYQFFVWVSHRQS